MASLISIAAIERLTSNLFRKPDATTRLIRCEAVRELATENISLELREKALQSLTDYWTVIAHLNRFKQTDLFAFVTSLIIFSREADSCYFLEVAFRTTALHLTRRERKLIAKLLGGFAGDGTRIGASAKNALIDLAELAPSSSEA